MLEFNDKNIFVGYIKELLHTFNLPTVKVYDVNSSFLYDGAVFIKDKYIQMAKYVEDNEKGEPVYSFVKLSPFIFDKPIWNFTKTLRLNCNYYDSHTHAYLGDYLRFIRDYKHLDLMSMYNCFNNSVVSSLVINFKYGNEVKWFKTDSNYKIYSVPVKLDKKYTIAFSTNTPVEIICGIYSKGLVKSDDINILYESTYKKVSSSNFRKPFIYDNLTNDSLKTKFFYEHENDLKLFIKMPINNDTSITILEGEYLHTNELYLKGTDDIQRVWNEETEQYEIDWDNVVWVQRDTDSQTPNWKHMQTIFNFKMPVEEGIKKVYYYEYTEWDNEQQKEVRKVDITPEDQYQEGVTQGKLITAVIYGPRTQTYHELHEFSKNQKDVENINDLYFPSRLQLLELNTNMSFPLADRLIEYLVDNAITNIESISDNIERVQEALIKRQDDSRYVKVIENNQTKIIKLPAPTKTGILRYKHAGIWEDKYKGVLYNIAIEEGLLDSTYDILGYLDKDVEKKLRKSEVDIYEKE